jgi:hypothetical protein
MLHRLLCLVLLTCCLQLSFGIASAVYSEEAILKPTARYEESEFNFGTVLQGVAVRHSFIIENTGDVPLIIQSVRASCGCTSATAANTQVLPKQKGEVVAIFDTTGFDGYKEKSIRVFTNDPEQSETVLTLKGYVEGTVVINPKRIQFGEVSHQALSAHSTRSVSVSVKTLSDLKITGFRASSDLIFIANGKSNGKSLSFDVGISPNTPTGSLNERIFIEMTSDNGEKNSFVIPVIAVIKSTISIEPKVLSFGLIENNSMPLEKHILLSSRGSVPFSIKNISVSDSSILSYQIEQSTLDSDYLLSVRLDPRQVKKEVREKLIIKTSMAAQEDIQVDIYAAIPPKV